MINKWGSDGPISLPEPNNRPVVLDLDNSGFGMTTYGLVINFTSAQKEDILSGFFGPNGD